MQYSKFNLNEDKLPPRASLASGEVWKRQEQAGFTLDNTSLACSKA